MTEAERIVTRRLRAEIAVVMKRIRATTPRVVVSHDQAKGSEVWEACLEGRPVRRVIIYLRSSGCAWAMRTGGDETEFRAGCLDCEHSVADTTFGEPVSAQSYVRQFVREYEKYDFSEYPVLCLYNEGSIFNEKELPVSARREILRVIASDPRIKSVVLESLPEFIDERVLAETKDILSDKSVEIGIGLESADPLVRELCVNKSFDLKKFEQTARLVNQYCDLLAYILIKPSFMSEADALTDGIRTVRYAFSAGTKIVSLEPVNIGEYAMSGALSRLGLYRVPWLWTVLEVAKASFQLGEVRIGGQQFAPRYESFARNCELCTMDVKKAIGKFNATYNPRTLDDLDCACRAEWETELRRPTLPLVERIGQALVRLQAAYPAARALPTTITLRAR